MTVYMLVIMTNFIFRIVTYFINNIFEQISLCHKMIYDEIEVKNAADRKLTSNILCRISFCSLASLFSYQCSKFGQEAHARPYIHHYIISHVRRIQSEQHTYAHSTLWVNGYISVISAAKYAYGIQISVSLEKAASSLHSMSSIREAYGENYVHSFRKMVSL